MHGGQLRLDRYREVGARFEVILPRYRSRLKQVKTEPHAAPAVAAPNRLVVGL
jgi:hypothetical protein